MNQELRELIQFQYHKIDHQQDEIEKLEKKNSDRNTEIADKDSRIEELMENVGSKDSQIQQLEEKVSELANVVAQRTNVVAHQGSVVGELIEKIASKDSEIAELKQKVDFKERQMWGASLACGVIMIVFKLSQNPQKGGRR